MIINVITSLISSLISATFGKLWERWRPKKKPLVENALVSLVLYESECSRRLAKMRFTIMNPGPKKCSIRDVKLICSIPIPEVNLVAIGKWPKGDVNVEGIQKLPLLLPVDEPIQVFIHTENSDKRYNKEQYPETLEMQITLNSMTKPLTTIMIKQSDGHQYKQE